MPSSLELPEIPAGADDELLFRAITDTTSAGIIMHRGNRLIFANRALESMLGYSRQELLAMPFEDLVHPGFREQVIGYAHARLRGEAVPSRYEFAALTRSGRRCWLEFNATTISYQGEPAVLGTAIDITARKAAEAAHKKTEWMLQQILQGDPVPTFVIDRDHVVTHWNRACAITTGTPADAVVGTRRAWAAFYERERPVLADLVVERDTARLEAYYKDSHHVSAVVLEAYEAEGFFPRFGSEGLWLYFTAAPLKDARGQVVGAVETLVDITARKKSEASLREAYDELEGLVEKRTAQLARAKAALEEDIVKRRASEEELMERYRELEELNAKLRSAQEQLVQSDKLASIGQLAAGVAHEINNPIGFIQSNVGTLENYLRGVLAVVAEQERAVAQLPADHPAAAAAHEAARQQDLDYIRGDALALVAETREGLDRVRKIVADLKDFSRVDSSPVWQWADLHRCLDSTLNIVNNEVKYKADVVKDYGELPEVECLPSQLNQVFMNLLVNAAQAMGSARGTITLRSGREGEQVWVEVADDGAGIPAENLKRIFDPFFTTKPVGQGTGLGLSLAYGIVQKHHGSIEVSSGPGEGTCFRITLPIRQSHQEEAAP